MSNRTGIIAVIVLTALVVVAGFFWNEARKEIVFLCGNFEAGVSARSVRQQLGTGSFVRSREERIPSGSRIVAESRYPFVRPRCVIEMDPRGAVTEARLE